MKNLVSIVIGVIVLLVGIRWFMQQSAAKEAFDKHEALIAETNECLEMAEWNCAEKNVRTLLKEAPDDQNSSTNRNDTKTALPTFSRENSGMKTWIT